MAELEPCKYCGGKAKVWACDGSGAYYTDIGREIYYGRKMTHKLIMCDRCGIRTKPYLTDRGLWNAWHRKPKTEEKEVINNIKE